MAGGTINKDAKLTVGVDGTEDVAAAADKALRPWEQGAKKAGEAFKGLGSEIGKSAQTLVSDLTRIGTAAVAINFAQGISSFRQLQEASERAAIATGQGFNQLQIKMGLVSLETLVSKDRVLAWSQAVGRLTGDYKGAEGAVSAFNNEATRTGQSVEQLAPLAVTLKNSLGFAGNAADELGRLTSMADRLGTSGGPAGFHDRLAAVAPALSLISTQTDEARHKVEALALGLGKGLSPEAGNRVASRLIGDVTNDVHGYERFLGVKKGSLSDKDGHVKDPLAVLEQSKTKLLQMAHGDQATARFLASGQFGQEGAAALFNADFGAIRQAAGIGPSGKALKAQQDLAGSDAGKALQAGLRRDDAHRNAGENLSPWLTGIQNFAAENPLTALGLGAGVSGVINWAVPAAIKGAGGLISGALAPGAGVTAGGAGASGAGGLASGLAGPLGIVAAGVMAQGALLAEGGKLAVPRQQIAGQLANQFTEQRISRAEDIIIAAKQSGGTPEGFKKALGPGLMAQIAHDPQLEAVAGGIVQGGIDLSQLDAVIAQAVERGIKGSKLSAVVEIYNGTGGPVEAVQSGKAASGQN